MEMLIKPITFIVLFSTIYAVLKLMDILDNEGR